jgi:uncharacterized repeat protein (TIGR03803 family)
VPSFATLASFGTAPQPWFPFYSGVVEDSSGNLFGTTYGGGPFNNGTVYKVAAGSGAVTPLASFDSPTNGGVTDNHDGGVVVDSSGNLFGTNVRGGTSPSGYGSLYEIAAGSYTMTILRSFNDFPSTAAGLVEDSFGDLFGTADGSAFEVAAGSHAFTTLAQTANSSGPLVVDSSGDLFGTTLNGGAYGQGSVFEVAAGSNTSTTLASFDGSNGNFPYGLVMDSSGNLFGTAAGSVFEVAAGTRAITTLASLSTGSLGTDPSPLVVDGAGNLFGTTPTGGASNLGTVFEIPAGSHSVTTLVSFNGPNGANPYAGLFLDNRGNLFGTTAYGGAANSGTVFELQDPSPAANSQSFVTPFNTAQAITLYNTDPEGDPLIYTVTNPANGTLSGSAPNLVYKPNSGFSGNDSFQFSIADSVTGLVSNTAKLSITVLAPFTPTITLSGAGDIYTGSAFPAVATLTGRSGIPTNSLEGVGLTLDYAQLDTQGNVIADLGSTEPTQLGSYQVTASFPGSTTYLPASAATSFAIVKASPTMTAAAGPTVLFGTGVPLTASATLTGPPGMRGTVTFVLYDASGAVVDTESAPVNGPGTYSTHSGYVSNQTGIYQWSVQYSGDANDNSALPAFGTTPTNTLTGVSGVDGVAIDAAGNCYVAELGQGDVAVFAPGSTTPTSYLTGISNATSLALDHAGNLFVGGYSTSGLWEFAPGSTTPTATLSGVNNPEDLVFDASGNLFVSNAGDNTVSEFAPGSTTPTTTLTGLSAPQDMAFDAQGDLFVTNYDNGTVSEFAPGSTTPTATLTGLSQPYSLAFDARGNLFVSNGGTDTVSEFAPGSTTPTVTITGFGAYDLPRTLAADSSGDVFIADWTNGTISEFAPGSTTPTVTLTGLNGPNRMGFASRGNLYVTNYFNSTVSEFMHGMPLEAVVPVVASYVGTTPGNPDPYIAGNLVTSSSSITYALTFNEPVTGVDASQFVLATTGDLSVGSVQVQPLDSMNYTATVSGISGQGTLGLNLMDNGGIRDSAGNAFRPGVTLAVGPAYTIDTNPPVVQSFVGTTTTTTDPNNPGALLTNATSVSYSLTFSQPVTGVSAADFGMSSGFGTPSLQVMPVAGSNGTSYTITVHGITGNGEFSVGFNTLTGIEDQAGFAFNLTGAPTVPNFPSGQTYTIDQVPPVVLVITPTTLTGAASLVTSASSVSYAVTFSEPVTGVDDTDFTLTESGTVTATSIQTSADPNNPNNWIVTISGITGNGTLGLQLAGTNHITDLAGNALSLAVLPATLPQSLPTIALPVGESVMDVADVNGDGKGDLIIADSYTNSMSVMLGNGNGTFQPSQPFAVGVAPFTGVVADVNGDGKADLIMLNGGAGIVSVMPGNGDGTFQGPQTYPTGGDLVHGVKPLAVAVADINGDGKPDLVVANGGSNYYDGNVNVLLNNGDGTLQAPETLIGSDPFGRPFEPESLAVADVSGDGKPDIVIGTALVTGYYFNPGKILLLQNDGSGSFPSAQQVAGLGGGGDVALADLNGDGKADIVVGNGGDVTLALNNGDGTFTNDLALLPGVGGTVAFGADLTGSGKVDDLVVSSPGANTVNVLLGVPPVYTIDTNPPVVQSFVGTTTTTTDPNNPGALLTNATSVTYSLTFSAPVAGVNAADFGMSSGFGTPTLQVTPIPGSSGTAYTITVNGITGNGEFSVYFNTLTAITDQAGFAFSLTAAATVPNFPSGQTYTIDQVPPVLLAINLTTLASPGSLITSASSVSYTLTFSKPVTGVDGTDFTLTETGSVAATSIQAAVDPSNPNNWSVTLSGITGDGKLGLQLVGHNHISDLAGNALSSAVTPVTLQSLPTLTLPAGGYVMAVADIDGDGKDDLIIANFYTNKLSAMLGNGNGTFQNAQPFAVGVAPSNGVVADVNGDGKPDLLMVNPGTDTVSVMFNNGNGTFGSPQTYLTGTDPSVSAQAVAVADINGDGHPDLVVANSIDLSGNSLYSQPANVSVLLNNGNGTFQAALTLASGGPIVNASSVAVADVNGDGKPDIAVGTSSHYDNNSYQGYRNRAVVLLNDGSSHFTIEQNLASPGGAFYNGGPLQVAFADLSGSGKADLIIGNPTAARGVVLNNGNGTFTNTLPLPGVSGSALPFSADLTGNGKVDDLVVTNLGANTVNVFLGVPPVYTIDTPTAHIAANLNVTQAPDQANLVLSATDPLGTQESAAGFTYTLNWGDGTAQDPDIATIPATANNGSGVAVNHNFAADGSYLVSVTATNKDGAVSAVATRLVVMRTLQVANTADSGTGSLRAAMAQADADAAQGQSDVITFASSLAGAKIVLTSRLLELSGLGRITIDGSSLSTPITISGNNATRVFQIDTGVYAEIANVAITAGQIANGNGGGIDNYGTLTVSDCTLSGNSAEFGGGIYNDTNGTLTVSSSTLSGNSATINGGGIVNNGALTVRSGILDGNTANNVGGAICNSGTLTASSSSLIGNRVSSNYVAQGGGIWNTGSVSLSGCSVSDNTASSNYNFGNTSASGGGIFNSGTQAHLSLSGCTLSGNLASAFTDQYTASAASAYGGAIYSLAPLVLVTDCTLYENSAYSVAFSNTLNQNNVATSEGGGIYNAGQQMTVSGCTLSSNWTQANSVYQYYNPFVGSPYISSNFTGLSYGGAIYNAGTLGTSGLADASYGNNDNGVSDNGSFPTTATGSTVTGIVPTIDPSTGRIVYKVQVLETLGPGTPEGSVTLTYGDNSASQLMAGSSTFTSPAIAAVETPINAAYADVFFGVDDPSTSADLIPAVTARTPSDLQPLLTSLTSTGLTPTMAVALNIDPSTETAAISAVNSLTGTGTVALNLTAGKYTAAVLHPATGITLIINGVATKTIIDPDTPALTVTSGNVVVDGVTFTETGDAPTISVTGGSLTLRDSNVQGSKSFNDPAIAVSGGSTVDLGTPSSPGGNTITVTGTAAPVQCTGTNVVLTQGTTFQANGTPVYPAATTTLASSANAAVSNQAVTFIATVAAPSSGSPAPTGSVTFTDTTTGQTLGTVALSGGSARVTPASLSVGFHNIVARYSGDSNYISNSVALTQTVNQDPTTATITTSAATSIPGQEVTFTAAVHSTAPGSGVPSGSIDFRDTISGTDLGTVALTNGSATFTTSGLAPGSYNIQAKYSGDSNFLTSTASVSQKVTQAIYVLNATASGAVTVSGNGSINLPGNLVVDSSSKTALIETGNAKIAAVSIRVVGGVSQTTGTTLSPAATTGVASVADPLFGRQGPSIAGMTNCGAVSYSSGTPALNSGIYSSITVSGTASLKFNPGIYVIEGGGLSVSGSGSLSGTGVFLFNAGSSYNGTTDGGTFGSILLGGKGTISLSAPTSGPYAGVVLFQSPSNTRALSLGGNGTGGLTGTIYAPSATVGLSGNAQLMGSLVASALSVTANAGAFQLNSGVSSNYLASTSNWIANSILTVAVQDDTGAGIDTNELARISDAMAYLNAALGSFGVALSWAAPGTPADVHIHFASTTPQGGASDGVLGFTTADNDVYLVEGWNYSTAADATQVGAGQYDFQTLATHELAHTVGLGESSDPGSVMYEYLSPGTARRTFTDSNLALINTDADRFMKVDGNAQAGVLAAGPSIAAAAGTNGGWNGPLPGEGGVAAWTAALIAPAPEPGVPVLSVSSWLRADMTADGGDDILVGGAGDDLRVGGAGQDLLVGGFGLHPPAEAAQEALHARAADDYVLLSGGGSDLPHDQGVLEAMFPRDTGAGDEGHSLQVSRFADSGRADALGAGAGTTENNESAAVADGSDALPYGLVDEYFLQSDNGAAGMLDDPGA